MGDFKVEGDLNGKRTSKEIRKNGIQERMARVQEDSGMEKGSRSQGRDESEEFTDKEVAEILYKAFKPGWC